MPKDSYASGPSSNPSSKSYSGGGGGGVSSGKTTSKISSGGGKGGSLGVTTGKTIYGNTAFGPAGGMATGYATRTGNISGIGPSMTTFSNFRTPSGAAMFSGQAGNTPVTARNAQQAAGMLSAMQRAQGAPRRGGMLSGDPVMSRPLPAMTQIPPELQLSIPPAPSYLPEWSMRPPAYRYRNIAEAPWPGQAINPFMRGFATKIQDRRAPTVPSDVNLMGGLGMPGLGFRPAGYVGGFTQEQKDYYRGDSPTTNWGDAFKGIRN